jgi:hypothetical protein
MMNAVMLSVVMLSVVMLSVVMLRVSAPSAQDLQQHLKKTKKGKIQVVFSDQTV